MIELKGVSKSYNQGKVKAVDKRLSVKAGEILVLGPNGARPPPLKMMVGLQSDSGTIKINDL